MIIASLDTTEAYIEVRIPRGVFARYAPITLPRIKAAAMELLGLSASDHNGLKLLLDNVQVRIQSKSTHDLEAERAANGE